MIKYEILEDKKIEYERTTLYRVKALKDFANVKKGDLGGYVENYNNLSQEDNCWIYDNAKVYGNARVYDNAKIYDNAKVHGNSKVYDYAKVFDNAEVYGSAKVFGYAKVFDNAEIFGNAEISGHAKVFDYAEVYNYAKVYDNARVFNHAEVYDDAKIYDNARVFDYAMVFGNVEIYNDNTIIGKVCCNFENIIEIQNPKGRFVTGILKDDEIYYSVGCQINITEKEFRYRIENTNRGIEYNPHRLEYYKIIDMIKLYFGK